MVSRSGERRYWAPHPDLPDGLTLSLVVDGPTADRLLGAIDDVLPGKVLEVPSPAVTDDRVASNDRWCRFVAPEVGRRIRLRTWRGRLIFVVTQQEFRIRRPILGSHDAVLFHDVETVRLRPAVRLAIAGVTVFPPELVPVGQMAGPILEGFDELSEIDRAVIAELAVGSQIREIADRLGCTPKRVRERIRRIRKNLCCLNSINVAVLAGSRLSPFLELRDAKPDTS